jgi:hypothetical protein
MTPIGLIAAEMTGAAAATEVGQVTMEEQEEDSWVGEDHHGGGWDSGHHDG